MCAVPLRLKSVILGCLNLFMSEPMELSASDLALAQALADVASIAIIQDQATRDAAIREGHLQHALNSRIVIEQAKGMIAERGQTDMDEAFARLRAYARNHNRRLTEVAEELVKRHPQCRRDTSTPTAATTGAVAKRLGRSFIGFDRDPGYIEAAMARIDAIEPLSEHALRPMAAKRDAPRIPFASVVERGLLVPGTVLTDAKGERAVTVRPDGTVTALGIHSGPAGLVAATTSPASWTRVEPTSPTSGWPSTDSLDRQDGLRTKRAVSGVTSTRSARWLPVRAA